MDGGIDEALRILWQGNDSTEMVKREVGRHLEASSFLFKQMLRRLDYLAEHGETEKWSHESASANKDDGKMRSVWLSAWFTEASSRPESFEQRIVESPNSLSEMPQGRSHERWDLGAYWLQEPKYIPRVAKGVKERTNRLRGLGNAIVPQVAYQILNGIREVIANGEEEKNERQE